MRVSKRREPVLEATSKAIVRMRRRSGMPRVLKVVTNMIAAVTTQTLAEALAIVKKVGLDPEAFGRSRSSITRVARGPWT